MNFLRQIVLFLITGVLISPALLAAERVGDFSLLDHNGYFHSMSWYSDVPVIALLVQGTDSSTDPLAVPEFERLKQRYSPLGIEFFMINPMGLKDRDVVGDHMSAFGTDIPVLMDDAQLISEALDITVTGEVLLYDPRTFSVVFRGPAGTELENALAAVSAGRAVDLARVAVSGDQVVYPARLAHQAELPSYEKDIAPIIAENCAGCHRESGIAPFALDSHTMVRGWSPMIREVVMTKRMPPGQIDPHVGDFSNSMVLPDLQAQQLLHWIAAGAPKNSLPDPLIELEWPETRWAFGEPDYIIKIPPQEVPATGVLDYYNVVVPIELETDRWVRASQYIPGDRTVLHHTLHSIIPPGAERGGSLLGGDDPDRPDIAPYIPGQAPRMEPPDTGGLLKAGTRIAMQLHYTTTGRADDAELFSLTPHMHFRGKRMRFTATYPDGKTEELINIANYNYNWQLAYTLRQPKFMPAGTVITAVGAFDNSARNKSNPDPDRSVPWGLQSWDEMFFGAADWKVLNQEAQ